MTAAKETATEERDAAPRDSRQTRQRNGTSEERAATPRGVIRPWKRRGAARSAAECAAATSPLTGSQTVTVGGGRRKVAARHIRSPVHPVHPVCAEM